MRKLKIIEHISLDGVVQMTTTGPDDDFPYGDWTAPYRSPAGLQIVNEMYGKTCDVLFGRRTYDLLANYWPKAPQSPMADRLNAATKYVVTHRPESLEWGPFEAIGSDLVDNVRRIKAKIGPDLIVPGSSTLTSVLLDHGLADEVVLLVNPIVLGKANAFSRADHCHADLRWAAPWLCRQAYSSTSTSLFPRWPRRPCRARSWNVNSRLPARCRSACSRRRYPTLRA